MKIDQIKEIARLINKASDFKGFVSLGRDVRGITSLHILEEEFLNQFHEYNEEEFSEGYTLIYVDLPEIRIFAIKEAK